jgi:hypothetical protein
MLGVSVTDIGGVEESHNLRDWVYFISLKHHKAEAEPVEAVAASAFDGSTRLTNLKLRRRLVSGF